MVWELLDYGSIIHAWQKNKVGMHTLNFFANYTTTWLGAMCAIYIKMFNMREHDNSWTAPATSNMWPVLEVLTNTFWMATNTFWIGWNIFWMGTNIYRKNKQYIFSPTNLFIIWRQWHLWQAIGWTDHPNHCVPGIPTLRMLPNMKYGNTKKIQEQHK